MSLKAAAMFTVHNPCQIRKENNADCLTRCMYCFPQIKVEFSMKFTSRDLSLKRTPSKKQSGVFGVKISIVTKYAMLNFSHNKVMNKLQCLQKVFTPFDLLHYLLCYSLNLKWIQFDFNLCHWPTHKYPIMSKWNYVFLHFYKCIKN